MIFYVKKIFNPIWVEGASFRELILAYILYPTTNKNINHKIINGIIFYLSFVFYLIGFSSHGFIFTYYTSSPTINKLFANHSNENFSVKILEILCSVALLEIQLVYVYVLFQYLKRNKQFEKMFQLQRYADKIIVQKVLKLTELSCLINSIVSCLTVGLLFSYGFEGTDFTGKIMSVFWIIFILPYVRYSSCVLFLLYSYVIVLTHAIMKFSSQTDAFCQNFFNNLAIFDDRYINIFKRKYYFIITTINDTQGLISVLSSLAQSLVIPLMALIWLLCISDTDTFILQAFKWFLCPVVTMYASRAYFFNAYLSRIHSESKKLYSVLNSLIARGKVSLAGKRSLLLMIEGLSGRTNRMCYRDSIGSIVEQMDVLTSISATLQLLMLGITFKNIVSGDSNESRPSHSTKYFQTT